MASKTTLFARRSPEAAESSTNALIAHTCVPVHDILCHQMYRHNTLFWLSYGSRSDSRLSIRQPVTPASWPPAAQSRTNLSPTGVNARYNPPLIPLRKRNKSCAGGAKSTLKSTLSPRTASRRLFWPYFWHSYVVKHANIAYAQCKQDT